MLGIGSRRSHDTRAVVTGAGSGIGAAFARELGDRGGSVVCSDIDETAARRTADAIERRGGKATAVRCDVASLEEVEHLADTARDWFGGSPSFVVNNAGVGAGGTVVGETPIDDWRWVLSIDLCGVIYGCHVFTPILRAAGTGSIVNVASAASFTAAPGMAPYSVSKAGVLALSETLAAELAGTGVRVSVLCPTFVRTNIIEAGRITEGSAGLARGAMRFGMSAERVARTTLDAHDRGALHVVPQLDAKALWQVKRLAPGTYTRVTGLLGRVVPK